MYIYRNWNAEKKKNRPSLIKAIFKTHQMSLIKMSIFGVIDVCLKCIHNFSYTPHYHIGYDLISYRYLSYDTSKL